MISLCNPRGTVAHVRGRDFLVTKVARAQWSFRKRKHDRRVARRERVPTGRRPRPRRRTHPARARSRARRVFPGGSASPADGPCHRPPPNSGYGEREV